MTFNNVNLTK
jgi:hypothetical protein